jgi:hypothetical protein
MSALTEELLQQIFELEERIKVEQSTGRNVQTLIDRLSLLKEQFQLMNENLTKSDKVLKG